MSYVRTSSPLPQNSLDPCPPGKVRAARARLNEYQREADSGRRMLFNTVPPPASFPGLVPQANVLEMQQQSQLARASILTAGNLEVSAQREHEADNPPACVPLHATIERMGCEVNNKPIVYPLPPPGRLVMPDLFPVFMRADMQIANPGLSSYNAPPWSDAWTPGGDMALTGGEPVGAAGWVRGLVILGGLAILGGVISQHMKR